MSSAVAPARRHVAPQARAHDYLYDPAFVVSGARDFARSAFQAAMASAQVIVRPIYKTMFCEIKTKPRFQVVYHPNCRLPEHMDRSYGALLRKNRHMDSLPPPDLGGKDRFKFTAIPRVVLPVRTVSPEFHPPTPVRKAEHLPRGPPVNRSMQTKYRESSAQTRPWQPDAKVAEGCEDTPEVLYLDKMEWGPGEYYRTGDLPADFHTTEIINKMRHARTWNELVEQGKLGKEYLGRDGIISDIETRDWLFREAEIDELQNLRLELLEQETSKKREKRVTRVQKKLSRLWERKKDEMQKKITAIHQARDRELRKLRTLHESGGRSGLVERMRSSRGGGSVTVAACDPTSETHAPQTRHGYQARRRHADITYDPSILAAADHARLSAPPAWLESCGKELARTCSGHARQRDPTQLCERETRWSEEFLHQLHMSLKQARLGAAGMISAGPCRVLVSRKKVIVERPSTPVVDAVADDDEECHQSALMLQRIIRGRAVQMLMYEGRTRAAELTEELKTTHGLQREDKERIEREQLIVRDKAAAEAQQEHKDSTITGLVEELCGGAVSAALDFLEKELRRLRDERKQHAFILIALRDKQMREAAEAGRRQLEERRRREHDQMFRQVIGVTQESVDAYLNDIVQEGVEMCAEEEAVVRAKREADRVEQVIREQGPLSSLQQSELVAELVHQLAIPEAQRQAARRRLRAVQDAGLAAARAAIFNVVDRAEIREETCLKCGRVLGETCACAVCPINQEPVERPEHRDDPRWRFIRKQKRPPQPDIGVRYPPEHEFRCLMDTLVDEAVVEARAHREDVEWLVREQDEDIKERVEVVLDCKDYLSTALDVALEARTKPPRRPEYHHTMYRHIADAVHRDRDNECVKCSKLLPSEIRKRAEAEKLAALRGRCVCDELDTLPTDTATTTVAGEEEEAKLLPSQLRALEELRRCKCDDYLLSTANDSLNVLSEESGLELLEADVLQEKSGSTVKFGDAD